MSKKKRIYLGCNLSSDELFGMEERVDKKLMKERAEKGLKEIVPKIIQILRKNKIKKAGIFGSYARGEQRKNSDIDILIEPPKGIGLGFVEIAIELEEKLGKRIDLITYKYISPYIKKDVLMEEVRII